MLINYFINKLEEEYHQLSLWYFVSFIFGIIFYFSHPFEVSWIWVIIFPILLIILLHLKRKNIIWQFGVSLFLSFFIGMGISKIREISVSTIILPTSIISKIKGRIESIKPTQNGVYLILKNVEIIKTNFFLKKVKVSLPHKFNNDLNINDNIILLAKLFKPNRSVLPGSFDYGFHYYFAEIGATGYAMAKPQILHANDKNFSAFVYNIRNSIYNKLILSLGKRQGNFVAAIVLGETKAIDKDIIENMRISGLSHMLCVSGLHLSLVATIIFILVRFLLNLVDYIAFKYNIKILASLISLIISYFYLEISGKQIAATRAFVMVAIFIISLIIGRSSYPLRSIAIAAFIILCFTPESIFHPSFQLSFAAVLSLISGYKFYLKNKWILGGQRGVYSKIRFYLLSNIYTSILASVVTSPISIHQFYIFPIYSILMNLLVMPIMTFLIMPLSIISTLFMLLGLEGNIINLLGYVIKLVIKLSALVKNFPKNILYFGYITSNSVVIFLLGFFWLTLWQTRWRLFGVLIIVLALILMLNTQKPEIIYDINLDALGVVNEKNQLKIYAEKMPNFNLIYWATWFGQDNCEIETNKPNLFKTKNGEIIALNYKNSPCHPASIQLNIGRNCPGGKLNIDKELLDKIKVIAIFCNSKNCVAKYNSHYPFSTNK